MKTVSCGVGKINKMRIRELKGLKDTLLIEEYENKPLVAVVPYEFYLKMQNLIIKAAEYQIKEMHNA